MARALRPAACALPALQSRDLRAFAGSDACRSRGRRQTFVMPDSATVTDLRHQVLYLAPNKGDAEV